MKTKIKAVKLTDQTEDITDNEKDNEEKEVSRLLRKIRKNDKSQNSRFSNLFILFVSILLFFVTGLYKNSFLNLIFLIVIILFHEFGHLLAMKFFKFKNLKLFFIPLFGAAVTGKSSNNDGFKNCLISLFGPLPGIIAAIILMFFLKDNQLVRQIALISLIINGFNLLPILPLDGGNIINSILFNRNKYLQVLYQIFTVAAIFILAIDLKSIFFAILGLLIIFTIKPIYVKSVIVSKVKSLNQNLSYDIKDPNIKSTISIIYDIMRKKYPRYLKKDIDSIFIADIIERLNYKSPSIAKSITVLFLYFLVSAIALVAISVLSYS
ncbi:MAG TPA: site-2 protease family protein [Spirochaetota bacterium]|nr:site-2 protease family protein [Spirochaetota bacterium]